MSASDAALYVACGSLPHQDVDAAVALALEASVPCLPTLPKLSQSERIDRQGLRPESFAAWDAVADELTGRTRKIPRFKLQLPGPWTAPKAWGDDPSFLVESAGSWTQELWIALDEPGWATTTALDEAAARLGDAIERLRARDRKVGVHCCGETDWRRLFDLEPDFVSFDAELSWDSVTAAVPKRFFDAGGKLIVGLPIPWLSGPLRLERRLSPSLLHWSTACGLANTSIATAKRAERQVLAWAQAYEGSHAPLRSKGA